MKKVIKICQHPYMWRCEVTFGTLKEMIDNCYYYNYWSCVQVFIGGTFNEWMKQRAGKYVSLVEIGVELNVDGHYAWQRADLREVITESTTGKGIRNDPREGAFVYYPSLFDTEISQGLYPVKVDWDGKTYVERYDGNGKYHYERSKCD